MTGPAGLAAEPESGRVFVERLLPGIADATGSGRVRLDALARWLQDVAYRDLLDAGFEEAGAWVIRRQRLRVELFPRFGEPVALRTFCSGMGRFAAERRTSIRGATARVQAVALWIWLDAETLRPMRFPPAFVDLYSPSADGRGANVRLRHPDPPASGPQARFEFRATDLDVAGHVNNSHYFAVLEEELTGADPGPVDVEIEYREPGEAGDVGVIAAGDRRWIVGADGRVLASIAGAP
ncbi:MAG: acyl-ACP thioesterase domain-containing protein [Solirubrobacterales bacterium]